MRKALTASVSVSTRTPEFTPRELALQVSGDEPRPDARRPGAASERIRHRLRRWFEEEL